VTVRTVLIATIGRVQITVTVEGEDSKLVGLAAAETMGAVNAEYQPPST